jgi:hypothetical protein
MKYSILVFLLAAVQGIAAATIPATGPVSSYLALHPYKAERGQVHTKRADQILANTGLPHPTSESIEPVAESITVQSLYMIFCVSGLMVSVQLNKAVSAPESSKRLANLPYLGSSTIVFSLLTVIFHQPVAPDLVAQPEPPALDSYSQLIEELLF